MREIRWNYNVTPSGDLDFTFHSVDPMTFHSLFSDEAKELILEELTEESKRLEALLEDSLV